MPYIIVSNTVKPSEQWRGFAPPSVTFIEYEGKKDSLLGWELSKLPGTRDSHSECIQRGDTDYFHAGVSGDRMKPEFVPEVRDPAHTRTCTFCTGLPPHVVLNLLERHGYKLVGTNVVEWTCIWTLHKPAEAEKRA